MQAIGLITFVPFGSTKTRNQEMETESQKWKQNGNVLTLWFPASREKFMATEWEIEKF